MNGPRLSQCQTERETVKTKSINLMTRQQVRNLAGKLMEEWQNVDAVADVLGCQPSSVRRWHMDYKRRDLEGSSPSKDPGRPSKLTQNQQTIIQDIIFTKTPTDMNHDEALWSNVVIRATIQDLFKIQLSLGTVNAMIRRMGIVRRHIFKPAAVHQDAETADWLKDRFPFIRTLAHQEHARILYLYDDIIDNRRSADSKNANACHPNGDYPHEANSETRMLSAVCARNSQRFMIFSGPFGPQPFIRFITGLLHDYDRHLFLIAEHDYKQVAFEADHFLSSAGDRFSLFFISR
jgi:transposase